MPLVVAGGAGPLHAAAIVEDLEIPVLVVPRESSVFCAGGMMLADFKHDYVRSLKGLLPQLSASDFASRWKVMRDEGAATLVREGIDVSAWRMVPSVDLRYRGQWQELNVEAPFDTLEDPDLYDLAKRFHDRHDALFGYSTLEMPIEVTSVRLSVTGVTRHAGSLSSASRMKRLEAVAAGHRDAWSRPLSGADPACFVRRYFSTPGRVVERSSVDRVVDHDHRGAGVLCRAG